jgi:gliding motility-associated lipoprotein GldH
MKSVRLRITNLCEFTNNESSHFSFVYSYYFVIRNRINLLGKWIIFCIPLLLLFSCDQNRVFEKNVEIPGNIWSYDFKVPFEVEITDTSASYNVYVNIRHTEIYPFNNLWVIVHTELPSGEKKEKRVELVLSDNRGEFFGEGMGDIWDYQALIQENAIFPQRGKYKFELEQNMRKNALPFIMSMGMRIEKNHSPRK